MAKKSTKKIEKALKALGQRSRPVATYEAARPSKQRKFRTESGSANAMVGASVKQVRNQVRYLERNHDLTRGALRVLVNNIVGPSGIGIEPQPRRAGSNEIHAEYAKQLRDAWAEWQRKPEVTWQFRWTAVQRMMAKTWIRDGEAFAQTITGPVQYLDHGTRVPFSLELLEPDMVPLDYDDLNFSSGATAGIRQGIKRNAWGRPISYFVHKADPVEFGLSSIRSNLKEVPAERMLHIASVDRINQLRGMSEFASVITRMEDIKDYEESERVAAKIAAMLTAYVKRGNPDLYDADSVQRDEEGNPIPRDISLSPGTIIDTLAVGEEIGLVDSSRPNPNLVTFRQGQLRAFAAGIGASNSSVSKDYNGTYSAQRQELVEQWVHYACLTDEFVGQLIQPTWERFVLAAHLSGVAPFPRDLEPGTHDDALYIGQSMPWIDPAKEANAWLALVQAGFASEVEVLRKRGTNPRDVLEQIASFRKDAAERGLKFSSDFGNTNQTAPVQADHAASKEPDPMINAMATMAAGIGAMAGREQQAPGIVVQNHIPATPVTVNNTVEPTPVTVQANLDAANVTINVEPTPVNIEVQPAAVNVEVQPAAVDVTVEAIMPAKSEVSITSMPARNIETTVNRSANGEMVGSSAVEKDG